MEREPRDRIDYDAIAEYLEATQQPLDERQRQDQLRKNHNELVDLWHQGKDLGLIHDPVENPEQ